MELQVTPKSANLWEEHEGEPGPASSISRPSVDTLKVPLLKVALNSLVSGNYSATSF